MYRFMKLFSWIVCRLSRKKRQVLGTFLGELFWLLVPKKRKRLAKEQILSCRITTDPEQATTIAKAGTTRFGPMIISVLTYPLYKKRGFGLQITWRGKEHLDALRKSGKGAVIMASHAGNWEMLGAALAMEGYPLISVAQKQNNKGADRFINEYRTMMHQQVTYKTGIRDMIRLLHSGHYIGLLMDQDPGMTGIAVKFFGKTTLTADGPAKLAGLGNYPIYSLFIREPAPYCYVIEVTPPIFPYDRDKPLTAAEKRARVREITQCLNDRLEAYIRQYPEDWFWLHNRWKWTRRYEEIQNKK